MGYNKEEIEGITLSLVGDYDSSKLPIQFFTIIEKIEKPITIYSASFKDKWISWMTKRIWSEYEIYINREQADVRKRFSTAHELGHIILWHLSNQYERIDYKMRKDGWYNPEELKEEKEANLFASALLMPAHLVQKLFSENKQIYEMSSIFWVSDQAIRIRLFNLWYTFDE